MQSSITHAIEITLVLTKAEADWLHAFMQNSNDQNQMGATQESRADNEMRRKFWEATKTSP